MVRLTIHTDSHRPQANGQYPHHRQPFAVPSGYGSPGNLQPGCHHSLMFPNRLSSKVISLRYLKLTTHHLQVISSRSALHSNKMGSLGRLNIKWVQFQCHTRDRAVHYLLTTAAMSSARTIKIVRENWIVV